MSAKPLLFASPHMCWQQRIDKERKKAHIFHDATEYQTMQMNFPEYLSKLDDSKMRSWRMNHPRHYEEGKVTSRQANRTTSMNVGLGNESFYNTQLNVMKQKSWNFSPVFDRKGGKHNFHATDVNGTPVPRSSYKKHFQKTYQELLSEN